MGEFRTKRLAFNGDKKLARFRQKNYEVARVRGDAYVKRTWFFGFGCESIITPGILHHIMGRLQG
jgi:hypothetical protein